MSSPNKHLNAATLRLLRCECFSALRAKSWHFHSDDINRGTRGCNWDKTKNSKSLHFGVYFYFIFFKLVHCYITYDEMVQDDDTPSFQDKGYFFGELPTEIKHEI